MNRATSCRTATNPLGKTSLKYVSGSPVQADRASETGASMQQGQANIMVARACASGSGAAGRLAHRRPSPPRQVIFLALLCQLRKVYVLVVRRMALSCGLSAPETRSFI